MERRCDQLEEISRDQARAINAQERFSRRNNVRIVGFKSQEGENCTEIAKAVFRKFGDFDIKIERAHRDGKPNPARDRHILVKLALHPDKLMALKYQRQKLSNDPYFITDDLSRVDLQEKRKYGRQVSLLYSQGVKLRFSVGRWRDAAGKPYIFESASTE